MTFRICRSKRHWYGTVVIIGALLASIQTVAAEDPVKIWGPEGVPIIRGHHAISDTLGGVVIVGEPSQATPDQSRLVVQHIDGNGVLIWEEGDICVNAPGHQTQWYSVPVVGDGAGGAIVVWDGTASPAPGLYAQHLDAGGHTLWESGGVRMTPSCDGPGCYDGRLVSAVGDGTGGAIITWVDWEYVWVQRVDASGLLLWNPSGVQAARLERDYESYVMDLKIIEDGTGGSILAWQDRIGDVYAQRVDGTGLPRWSESGLKIWTHIEPMTQSYLAPLAMIGDGSGGAVLGWTGSHPIQSNYRMIYTQKFNEEGVLQWPPGAVPAFTGLEFPSILSIVTDGSGGMIIVWNDYSEAVLAQKITGSGTPAWGSDGIVIYRAPLYTYSVGDSWIVNDGNGGAIVVWIALRFAGDIVEGKGVYGQHLSGAGEPLWGPLGFEILFTPNAWTESPPRGLVVSDGTGGVIACGETGDTSSGGDPVVSMQRVTDQFVPWSTRTLKVRKKGEGTGTVTSVPGNLECGFPCWEAYPIDTEVTLTATASDGSVFLGWEGDPDCSDGKLLMDANRTCEARFELWIPNISVSPESKNFGGIDVGTSVVQTFSVTNNGYADLVLGRLILNGPNASEYLFSADDCSDKAIPSQQSCQFEITFVPLFYGAKSGQVIIPSNDPDEGQKFIDLTGEGVELIAPYFPTSPGTLWTYEQNRKKKVTTRILEKVKVHGTKTAVFQNSWATQEYYSNDQNGIRLHRMVEQNASIPGVGTFDFVMTFYPPVAVAGSVINIGQTFESTGTVRTNDIPTIGIETFPYSATFTLESSEPVMVPAGDFQAIRISGSLTIGGVTESYMYYLVKELGRVKSITVTPDMIQLTRDMVSTNAGYTTFLTPLRGEILPSGGSYEITWEASVDASSFELDYSLNNGKTWTPISTAERLTGDRCLWGVPVPTGNKTACRLRITGYNRAGKKVGTDISDLFTIAVVEVTAPQAGDVLVSAQTMEIKWDTHATNGTCEKVKLFFSKDGGTTWIPIPADINDNPGSFLWTIPDVNVSKIRSKVKVVLVDIAGNSLGRDTSEGFFTIQPAATP